MIPCRHMLCFAFFVMIPVTLIDFTPGVGLVSFPRRCCLLTGDGAKSLVYTSWVSLFVDTATTRFYLSILFSPGVSLIWFRFDAHDVDTPFHQSSEAPFWSRSLLRGLSAWLSSSRSASFFPLSICDASSLLLLLSWYLSGRIYTDFGSFSGYR